MRLIGRSVARNYPSTSVRSSYPVGKLCTNEVSKVTKLGISVEPAEVRLITSAIDPYTWRILPEKQYLFKKHLSKHSIGAYRELCREVGISFEAALKPQPSTAAEGGLLEERRGAMVGTISSAQP